MLLDCAIRADVIAEADPADPAASALLRSLRAAVTGGSVELYRARASRAGQR
jgi:hypothetical protein